MSGEGCQRKGSTEGNHKIEKLPEQDTYGLGSAKERAVGEIERRREGEMSYSKQSVK